MTTTTTALDLDAIDARAAHLYEYVDQPEEADVLAGTDVPALVAEVKRLRKENEDLNAAVDEEIGNRDEAHDLLNRFAYTIAPQEVIGEHSSGNDPWENALDLITPAATVDELEAELEQSKRGGAELGKTVVFLAGVIKAAFVRGADDPIGALNILGNCVGEWFEDEGGLSPAEFNRVQRALNARESEEEKRQRESDEQRRAEVSRSLADLAHAQRPLTGHERAFQGGV